MDLKTRFVIYRKKGLLTKNKRYKELAERYLEKARNNLIAMQIDFQVSENDGIKENLKILGFEQYDWVVVKGYYAMYMAVLACLAKLGFKSDSHNVSICALEFYFVNKGKLENDFLDMIKNAGLEREYIDNLINAKEERVSAQYDVSKEFQKRKAIEIMNNAKKFVDRLEELFYEIKENEK